MATEDHSRPMPPAPHEASTAASPTDPGFLLHAEPAEVLSALASTPDATARLTAMVFRTSLAQHHAADPYTRRHLLSLDAARWGATELAQQFATLPVAGSPTRWQVRWATRSVLDGAVLWSAPHGATASSVASSDINSRPVIVTGHGRIRVWDLLTGKTLTEYEIGGGTGLVATAVVNGRPVVVTSGHDGSLWIVDLVDGTPLATGMTGHTGPVRAITTTMLADRPIAITGSDDKTIRVWDLASGQPVGKPWAGHERAVLALATGVLDGRPVVVSAGNDKTVRVWDLASGQPIGQPLEVGSRVATLAVTELAGCPVVVTAGPRIPVEVWELNTARRVDPPLAHSVPPSPRYRSPNWTAARLSSPAKNGTRGSGT